jgi:hypothetical protein
MFDLDRMTAAIGSETEEEKCFVKYCREFGLDPNDLHRHVKRLYDGKILEIIGLKKSGRFASICATYDNGIQKTFLDIMKIKNDKLYVWID